MSCFVSPVGDRIPIQTIDGEQWIEVKHRLNAGEYEDMLESWCDEGGALKRSRVRRGKLLAYLLGWSLEKDGKPVPANNDGVRGLEVDVFRLMADAVEVHEQASEAERKVQKNAQDGASESSPIAPSQSS